MLVWVINMGSKKFNGIEIEWLGHATFKIKNKNLVIYIDPYVIPSEAEKADIILSTHSHFDHCDKNAIEKILKDDTIVVAPEECAEKFENGRAVKIGDVLEIKGVKIEVVHAYNTTKPFHPKGSGYGYIVEIEGLRIYHAGDTDFIPEMKEIKADIALLPIGGTYTMDMNEAVEAALAIKPKYVIPMHYGYLKETKADPEEFKRNVEEKSDIEVVIL